MTPNLLEADAVVARVDGVDVLVALRHNPALTVALHIPATASDALGYPPALIRWFLPTPGYTRHALGAHEAARDTRRGRRRPRRIGAA